MYRVNEYGAYYNILCVCIEMKWGIDGEGIHE